MSFKRRMELGNKIRELAKRWAFTSAGEGAEDRIEASILACEIEQLYIDWGLLDIYGLTVDGEPATAALVVQRGPDDLAHEIAAEIKLHCGLTEDERKK